MFWGNYIQWTVLTCSNSYTYISVGYKSSSTGMPIHMLHKLAFSTPILVISINHTINRCLQQFSQSVHKESFNQSTITFITDIINGSKHPLFHRLLLLPIIQPMIPSINHFTIMQPILPSINHANQSSNPRIIHSNQSFNQSMNQSFYYPSTNQPNIQSINHTACTKTPLIFPVPPK